MNLNKDLNKPQLRNWFNKKFRDEFMVISPYDKQAHKQILSAIENNGKSSHEDNDSINKRLDEILAAVENTHKYDPVDKDTLREELKFFMADKDLTIEDVAGLIKKDSTTVWKFLHRKVRSQDKTIYKIKKLLRKSE